MKRILAIILAVMIVASSASVSMAREYDSHKEPADSTILFDTVAIRPLGIAATALGVCVLIVSLPFTVPTKTADRVSKTLVVAPYEYTFERPIGYFE
jgi:hypothetical protein